MGASQNIPKTRIGVFATRDTTLGTAVAAGFTPNPCIIGTTFGAVTTIPDELVQRNDTPNLSDLLSYNTVSRILKVSDVLGGIANYQNNIDYELDDATNPDSIVWLGTVIPAPTGVAAVARNVVPVLPNTGLAPGTYFYVVTAIRQIDSSPATDGETVVSTEVSALVGAGIPATNAVQLTWTPVEGAQGYKVYRNTVTGVYTNKLIATVLGGASNGFLDDGFSVGAGTPPGVNNAFNRPADGVGYYVTYEATLFEHFTPKTYFSLNDVIANNGLGSNVTMAGTLILGATGIGQGASKITVVTLPDETEASYLQALDAIENIDVDYVIPLTADNSVQLDVATHVIERSSPIAGRPRLGVFGSALGTPIGDKDTVDTTIWKARRLEMDDDEGSPQGRRIVYISNNSIFTDVQQADGLPVEVELDGFFLAAACAGRFCSLPDVATSATFKVLQGITSLGQEFLDAERDFLQQNGLLTVFTDTGGIIKVYQDRTIDLLTVEDQERAIVTADDEIFRRLITRFKSFIGRKITPNFLKAVVTTTDDVLGLALKDVILDEYDKASITAESDSGEPRRVNVTFIYTPIFSANQIVFRRGFNV